MDHFPGRDRAWLLAPAAAAAALLAVNSPGLLSYLWSSPGSLGPQTLWALGGHALDVFLVAVSAAGAASFGRRALRAAGLISGEPSWQQWLFGLVVGEAALSMFLWLLVAFGACTFWPAAVLWLALAAAAWGEGQELREILPAAPRGGLALAGCAVVLAALASGAATAGAPPTNWDALANHFAVPKLYLMHGSFHRLPWSLGAHYPLSAEMQYAWLFSLRGEQSAQWLVWLNGALFIAAAGAWAASIAGRAAAWPAAALVAAAPPLARVLGTGKNDLLCALAVFAALLAAVEAVKPGRWRTWLLAGALAGASASVKLNGLWCVAVLALAAAVSAARERDPRPIAAFAAGAVLLGAPWYARDWAWTGNPFWPMLGGWLGDADGAAAFARLQASVMVGLPPTLRGVLRLPLALAVLPDLFQDPPRELIAAAVLALAACSAARRSLLPGTVWAFALAYAALWFCVCQEGRLLLPLTPILAGAVAAAWEKTSAPLARRLVCAAALALAASPAARLAPNNAWFGFLALSPEHDAAGARSRYLLRSIGAPYAVALAVNALPPQSRVLLYREVRGYYLDRDWVCGDPIVDGVAGYRDMRDAEELRDRLKEQRFTHVFYNLTLGPIAGDREYYERVDRIFKELVSRYGRKLAGAGPLALYELR